MSGRALRSTRAALAGVLGLGAVAALPAQPIAAARLTPNLAGNIDRPLRYRPDHGDFVIANGREQFNRPLYGGNTAFRADGGDRPQFVLYLPGRGGNLRVGFARGGRAKWADQAENVETRYRPGELLYAVRDPLLGPGAVLRLAVVAPADREALVVRAEMAGAGDGGMEGLEFIWAFGGVSGERGVRDGDIGTEKVPIGQWFQFQPRFCTGNAITLEPGGFTLRAAAGTLRGLAPAGSRLSVADGTGWEEPEKLLAGTGAPLHPIVVSRSPLRQENYLEVERNAPNALSNVANTFANAEAHFASLRAHLFVSTPDPFLDAAVGAMNVASDAVWDGPQDDLMHGAIAWRVRLLGWRGAYALDDLGWPERAEAHYRHWLARQNTRPIPARLPGADEDANLSRNEAGLHTNGDLSHSHYDMNLVFVDALFRHLRWTGNVALAREAWPVIERHLAWERRNFRREYGPERLPPYEGYAAIWASDDLEYGGGGSAHASAYNLFHNRIAAEVARWIGRDPAPYAREAASIARAMRELLWVPEEGMFGEYRDYLGLHRVHPTRPAGVFITRWTRSS